MSDPLLGCDSCVTVSAQWHIFARRAEDSRAAAADVRLSELKLCDRCWDYCKPVMGLFGWLVVEVFYLKGNSENLDG